MLDFVRIRHSDLHVPIRQTNVTSPPSSHLLHTWDLLPPSKKSVCGGFRAGQTQFDLVCKNIWTFVSLNKFIIKYWMINLMIIVPWILIFFFIYLVKVKNVWLLEKWEWYYLQDGGSTLEHEDDYLQHNIILLNITCM